MAMDASRLGVHALAHQAKGGRDAALGVAIPEVHPQGGAGLNLGVQHREGATRQLRHRYTPLQIFCTIVCVYHPPAVGRWRRVPRVVVDVHSTHEKFQRPSQAFDR
jgi:hypothetical protein